MQQLVAARAASRSAGVEQVAEKTQPVGASTLECNSSFVRNFPGLVHLPRPWPAYSSPAGLPRPKLTVAFALSGMLGRLGCTVRAHQAPLCKTRAYIE